MGFGRAWLQQKGCLAKLCPGSKIAHLLAVQVIGTDDDSNGVTFEGLLGENIDLLE
jgi:hypothetical protein